MKTIKLFIILFFAVNTLKAQENPLTVKPKKHEISFGMMNFTDEFNLSYDYLLKTNASIGASISYTPKKRFFTNELSYHREYNFSINYKHYISKKKHQGLYFSPVLTYTNGTAYKYNFASRGYSEENSISYQDLYLGIKVGYKHIFKNNFFMDANVGINKRITSNNSFNWHNSYRTDFNLSVGYRF